MPSSKIRVCGALVIALTGGCGDEEDSGAAGFGGQCEGNFTACGGALIGTWITSGACLTLPTGGIGNALYRACTTKPMNDVSIEASGSVTFRADGTFQSEQTITASVEIVISNECLAKVSNGETCEQLKGTARGDTCAVTQPPRTDRQAVSGRYTTQGSQLMMESADDDESSSVTTYCVSGDRLTVQTQSTNGAVIRSVGHRMR